MQLLGQLAAKSGAIDPRLIEQWEEIVGTKLARACRPVRLKAHGKAQTLVLAAPNGPSAMAIQYGQQEIITKVNQWIGRQAITRIQIRQTGAALLKPTRPNMQGKPPPPAKETKNFTPISIQATGNALDDALNRLKNNIKARHR